MNGIGKLAKASLMACLCLTVGCIELEAEPAEEADTTIETAIASPAPLNGTFLHISDIHFDPFADKSYRKTGCRRFRQVGGNFRSGG